MQLLNRNQQHSNGPQTGRPCTKGQLSPPRKVLLELMQSMGHGQIEGLVVRDHEPVLTPPPGVVREYKFGAENGPRAELATADFSLKAAVIAFFDYLDRARDHTIGVLVVKHGLPFHMKVVDRAA